MYVCMKLWRVILLGPPPNVFFFQLELISWMVTLSSCLICQIISFIFPPNEYGCLYAWTSLGNIATLLWPIDRSQLTIQCVFASLYGPTIDLQKMPILAKKKNYLFRWSSFWSRLVCKQAKLSQLGHRKSARIPWKADALKTRHCLLRILIQRHNWNIFLLK